MRSHLSVSPWAEFNRMWDLMDRFVPARDFELASATIPIDIYEQYGRIYVRASLSGVKPEDVKVSVADGVLTITGETKDDFEQREGNRVLHREHSYGKFVRSVRIPEGISEGAIDAHVENGILTVSMPSNRIQQNSPKQIQVRNAASGSQPIESASAKSDFAYADRNNDETEKPKEAAAKKG